MTIDPLKEPVSKEVSEATKAAIVAVSPLLQPLDATKPTVPEVLPLVQAYYAKPGNSTGGNLHIVLDDCNVTDADVDFCRESARMEGDKDGFALAEMLMRMSKTQRSKLALHRFA